MAELRQNSQVWKVGSRWSQDGHAESCILDLFRKHHIVFVGHDHEQFARIEEGDLVIISSGTRVVAFGRAMETPRPISETGLDLSSPDWPNIKTADIGLACRISFQDLKEEDFVGYRIGAFHAVHEKAEHYRELFRNYQATCQQEAFSIQARSCTLQDNPDSPQDVLLSPGCCYRIPIFQRPYSWGESEVRRLLRDLLNAFDGRLGRALKEPMFIGTMQLSSAKAVDHGQFTRSHDIIDGQQRMTTIALILRALQLLGGTSPGKRIDWLSTAIGGKTQQGFFDAALINPTPWHAEDPNNRYLENLNLILTHLEEDEALNHPGDFVAFEEYLTSRVFFVVIETRAGLSKTLQIFDSINTSGMDLNGGDVFKIRYFEYLREHEGCDEAVFETIAALYTQIDEHNKELGARTLSMEGILDCAKWIICEQLGLPYQAKELTGTTFFDRLFDTVLKIDQWDGFSYEKCRKLELPTRLFDSIVAAAAHWHRSWKNLPPEAMAMDVFLWWSRYGNYHNPLLILFIWRFQPSPESLEDFITACSKLLLIYSIRFQKKTYEGRILVHQILAEICTNDRTIESVNSLMREKASGNKDQIKRCLMEDELAYIPKSKNLVCRLVALMAELEQNPKCSESLCDLLFWRVEIDIEHIESANHKDGGIRTEVQRSWGPELHGLGNLTVLERHLNRSIGNEDYTTHKRQRYQRSHFASVRSFADQNAQWSLDQALARKTELSEQLSDYLCGPLTNHSSNQQS